MVRRGWTKVPGYLSTLIHVRLFPQTFQLSMQLRKELKENKQKDAKALFFLQQAVADNIFPRIMGATSAKDAWGTLKEEFEGSDCWNKGCFTIIPLKF